MRRVHFYFDFISPYAYLALERAEAFAQLNGIAWDLHPVLYGVLLNRTGLVGPVGPVETEAKRRYTFFDAARCARALDLPFVGPPAHPFRSLDAVRVACLYREDARALPLCAALARAAWADGRDLTDAAVLESVVQSVGLDSSDVLERASAQENKDGLRALTDQALDAGVFGVPTFGIDGQLFWGHDRMHYIEHYLAHGSDVDESAVQLMLARPTGVQRRI